MSVYLDILKIDNSMKALLVFACLIALVLYSQSAQNGIVYAFDISQSTPVSGFNAWRSTSFTHAVIRGLKSFGEIDTFAEANLENA